jgi:8-oxo-dGTP diphosphatase
MKNTEIRNEQGLTEREFLQNYDPNKYERPSVTNDVLIFTIENCKEENAEKSFAKKLQVLLIQRRDHPSIHKWALPGGFVNMDEDLIEGAYRELQEETGLTNIYVEQLGAFGEVYIDKEKTIPRDPRTRIITVGNLALLPKDKMKPVAGDDAQNVMWFDVTMEFLDKKTHVNHFTKVYILHLTSEDKTIKISYKIQEKISKDAMRRKETEYILLESSTQALAADHFKLIYCALDKIRKEIEYTPLALNLLPSYFTITELNHVYEAILGRKVHNLQEKLGDMIIKVSDVIERESVNSEEFYKFNEQWEHEF